MTRPQRRPCEPLPRHSIHRDRHSQATSRVFFLLFRLDIDPADTCRRCPVPVLIIVLQRVNHYLAPRHPRSFPPPDFYKTSAYQRVEGPQRSSLTRHHLQDCQYGRYNPPHTPIASYLRRYEAISECSPNRGDRR